MSNKALEGTSAFFNIVAPLAADGPPACRIGGTSKTLLSCRISDISLQFLANFCSLSVRLFIGVCETKSGYVDPAHE